MIHDIQSHRQPLAKLNESFAADVASIGPRVFFLSPVEIAGSGREALSSKMFRPT